LTPKETQRAIFHVKRYIEDDLCKELNVMMVEVPLIVDVESGVNDRLDRDGSSTPVQFLDHDHSAYVDQWDWERAINVEQMNLESLDINLPPHPLSLLSYDGNRGQTRVDRAFPSL
jgi:aspartate--ammonia ligase